MNRYRIVKGLCFAACLFASVAMAATDEIHWFIKNPAWVCATPEAYAQAIEMQKTLKDGQTIDSLEKELFDKQLCVFIDADEIGGLTAPYLSKLETRGDLWHVSFIIKFEKRIALLHRELNWYKFNGWTEASNLKELW